MRLCTNLVKSEILFDGVRCVEDFAVTRNDEEKPTQRLQVRHSRPSTRGYLAERF